MKETLGRMENFRTDAEQLADMLTALDRREREIEWMEAQIVFANLAAKWEITGQREYALMAELDAAEKRLISLFMDNWGSRLLMAQAWSAYRRRLLYHTRLSA